MKQAINALTTKHVELLSQKLELEESIASIDDQLKALGKAIKVFDPDFDLRSLKAKRNRKQSVYFKHGHLSTAVIDVMREAGRPMSTVEIAVETARKGGYDYEQIDQRSFRATLTVTLNRLKREGIFSIKERGRQGLIIWEVVD